MTRPTRFANKKRIFNEKDENLTINLNLLLKISLEFRGGFQVEFLILTVTNLRLDLIFQNMGFPHVF